MNREEITNSQDYKATKIALDWWYSLPEEQRKATDIDAEPDIVDAYSEGVIYGWNNPNWIPVEDELPKERGQYFVYTAADQSWQSEWMQDKSGEWHWFCSPMTVGTIANVTHWMEIQPPRKEDKQ